MADVDVNKRKASSEPPGDASRPRKRRNRFQDKIPTPPTTTLPQSNSLKDAAAVLRARLEAAKAAKTKSLGPSGAPPGTSGVALGFSNASLLPTPKSITERMASVQAQLALKGLTRPRKAKDLSFRVDESGKVIETEKAAVPEPPKVRVNPYLAAAGTEESSSFVDPDLQVKGRTARSSALKFVEPGSMVKMGDKAREKAAKRLVEGFDSGRNKNAYKKAVIADIDAETAEADETKPLYVIEFQEEPNIEWWDAEYLPKNLARLQQNYHKKVIRAQGAGGFSSLPPKPPELENAGDLCDHLKFENCKTRAYVQHPIGVRPPAGEEETPQALPMFLTKKERKRIRRQNRAEREREKQDKIALGLLPPPEPKMKISNFMAILGEQAVADPSAVEKKVQEQIERRIRNHEERNQANKLTPEERKAKKHAKLKEDTSRIVEVAVFRVSSLANAQARYKIDVNAQQHHLTGGVVQCESEQCAVVIAEGGENGVEKYMKLLLRRIKWEELTSEVQEDEAEEVTEDVKPPECYLVWRGQQAKRLFNSFRFQECDNRHSARKVLELKGCAHYWDLAFAGEKLEVKL